MNKSPSRLQSIVSGVCIALCVMLSSCGGGGDSGQGGFAATTAAGLYESTGGGVPATEVLVLDSGRIYAIYGISSASSFPPGGVIVADTATVLGNISSDNVHDFNMSSHTLSTGTAAGTFVAKTSINLTVSSGAGTITTLSGNYSNTYEQTPTLSGLAGTYVGETADLGGTRASAMTVDSSGVLAATSSGCSYTGVASPHSTGNVFDVTLTFGTGCTEAGNTLRGHAFVSHSVLYVVVVNGDLSRAVLFTGVTS